MKTWRLTVADAAVAAVVVVLVLLLVMPAGLRAGRYGMEVACQANVRGLLQAWDLYHEDNDDWLVGGSNYYSGSRRTPYRWVEVPLFSAADNPGAPPEGKNSPIPSNSELTHEYDLNGIRAGKLFPYTDAETLYHCPADKNWNTHPQGYALFRSYSIPGLMNSEEFIQRQGWPGYVAPSGWRAIAMPDGTHKPLPLAQEFTEITSPDRKYVFVEEDAATHGQTVNAGGFILMGSGYWYWWDWPAAFHGNQSVLGFVDGHTDVHRWMDLRTICLMKQQPLPGTSTIPDLNQPENPDLDYMRQGYLACD